MAELSPAAQAIDRAIADRIQLLGEMAPSRQVAAAALRAAVEQVTPELGCTVYGLTTREHERQQVRREFLAIAAELDASTDTSGKTNFMSILQWTSPQPPSGVGDGKCPYNHCTAETPFGRFLITWKGWKRYDSPTVDETPWGDWFAASFESLEAAQQACENEYRKRLQDQLFPEGQPTDEELWELWLRLDRELPDRPAAVAAFWEHAQVEAHARWSRPTPAPAEGELTDEELENAASAAEAQNMRDQGGLTASGVEDVFRQIRKQRLAGLRAVATLAAAAALRAAVDQVLPDYQEPGLGTCDIDLCTEHQRKRSALLAIAAELNPTTETK